MTFSLFIRLLSLPHKIVYRIYRKYPFGIRSLLGNNTFGIWEKIHLGELSGELLN